jgi:hypothetical protein
MDNKVLDEAVEVAMRAAFDQVCRDSGASFTDEDYAQAKEGGLEGGETIMRAALLAGVKVLLGPVVAYETVTPTDDPDVFDARLWAAAPGMTIPEGAIRLYAPDLGGGK